MIRCQIWVAIATTIAFSSVPGCHRAANSTPEGTADSASANSLPVPAANDTVRGVLTLVGSDPLSALLITTSRDERLVLETAMRGDAQMLRNVIGLEITVRGRRTGERSAAASPQPLPVFSVSGFVVRRGDGHVAFDGVVSRRDNAFDLLLTDGTRVPSPRLPASLRQKIGARVFVVGPLDAPPISYGVISANQPPI